MFKPILRIAAKTFGYEVMGPPRAYAAGTTLHGLLTAQQINLVLDVGANVGQFVDDLHKGGYAGRVISFEPQATAHRALAARATADPRWTVAARTAIGSAAGSITIHNSRNSWSSSVLPMLASHSDAEPTSGYVSSESVPVNRLDDLYTPAPGDRTLLKIDVQGYEKPVLDGAPRVLADCHALIVEMSLVPLYEGQQLAKQLWDHIDDAGFDAWAFEPGIRSPSSHRMLQMDALFVRRGSLPTP